MINKLQSLRNHKGFMKYFKNTSWLLGEKILRIFVGLFVGVWVARYLGPEQFGLFSYAQSFVGIFATIATLGLDGIVVRELVKDEGRRDELIGTAFWLKLMGAFAVLLILAIAVKFTSNDHFTNILIFIIASATIFQSFNAINFYFQSKVLSKYVVYASVISLSISSMVKIALILYKAPLIAFAWIVVFDNFILAIGFIYFYFKNSTFKIQNLTFNKQIAVSLLKDSWPLVFSSVAIMIYMKVDQVMIQEFLGSESVGLYSAGIRIVEALYFIPTIVSSSIFPSIVKRKEISEVKFGKDFQDFVTFMFYGSFAIMFPLFLYSHEIVLLLFGHAFESSYTVTSICCWILLFIALGVSSSKWLLVHNMQKFAMYRTYLGLVINIVLNYLWIPKYGIEGAAYASLISQIFASYLGYITHKDTWILFKIQTKAIFPLYLIKRILT